MYTDWKDIPESILETAKKSGRGTSFFAREIEQTSKLRYYRELYINKYKIDEPFLEATEEIAKTNTYIKLFLEPGGTPYNGSQYGSRVESALLEERSTRNYIINKLESLGVNVELERPKTSSKPRNILGLTVGASTLMSESFRKYAIPKEGKMIVEEQNQQIQQTSLLEELLLAVEVITSTTSDYEVMLNGDEIVRTNMQNRCSFMNKYLDGYYIYDVNNGIIFFNEYFMGKASVLSEKDKENFASYGIKATIGYYGNGYVIKKTKLSFEIDLNKLKEKAGPVMKMSL